MALEGEEEQEVNSIEPSDYFYLPYDELLEGFHKLMHDSTLLAKRLNNMKSMHKNLNKKHHESSKVIAILKSENSLLTSKLNKMSSNVCDCSEKDNLINTIIGHLEKNQLEIESLKTENCTLTSRLHSLDHISDSMNILKDENNELKNTNQDMLNKLSILGV